MAEMNHDADHAHIIFKAQPDSERALPVCGTHHSTAINLKTEAL